MKEVKDLEIKTTRENKCDKESKDTIIKELIIELEKIRSKTKTPVWKIILYISISISAIIFLGFSCFIMYKQRFTMETLLTVLLSFFSIGLSIMFYIKAEKSSSLYYMKSYEIMKEVSVALGKIESGFGEKLTDIKSNLDKIDSKKKEMESRLQEKQEDENELKNEIIKKLQDNTVTYQEKNNLIEKLQTITREKDRLESELKRMDMKRISMLVENHQMKKQIHSQEIEIEKLKNDKKNNFDLLWKRLRDIDDE